MNSAVKNLNFRTVFDAAADAMLLTENTGHIVLTNPTAQELLGYSADEMKGLAIEMLIAPRYRKQYRYYQRLFLNRPVKRSMSVGNELIALNRDGKEILLRGFNFEVQHLTVVWCSAPSSRRIPQTGF